MNGTSPRTHQESLPLSRTSAPLPWAKFFVGDYLLDPDIKRLSLAAQGIFIRLWCIYAREGHLPENLGDLAAVAGVSLKTLRSNWPGLHPLFVEEGSSRFGHRMRQAMAETHAHFTACRTAGSKGGLQRAENARCKSSLPPQALLQKTSKQPEEDKEKEVDKKIPAEPIQPSGHLNRLRSRDAAISSAETLESILDGGKGTLKFEGYWRLVASMGGSVKNPKPKTTARLYSQALLQDEVNIASIQGAAEAYAGGFKRTDQRYMVQLEKWLEQGGYLAQAPAPLKTAQQLKDERWLAQQEARVVRL